MMSTESMEILNGRWKGEFCGSANSAAINCLMETLTMLGEHDVRKTLQIVNQEGKEGVLKNLTAEQGFNADQQELLSDAWDVAVILSTWS